MFQTGQQQQINGMNSLIFQRIAVCIPVISLYAYKKLKQPKASLNADHEFTNRNQIKVCCTADIRKARYIVRSSNTLKDTPG